MTNDIRVTVKFRNNLLLTAMERAGFNQRELAERAGISQQVVNGFITMKQTARQKRRPDWRQNVLNISSALGVESEDLFSDFQQHQTLTKNNIELAQLSSTAALDLISPPPNAETHLIHLEASSALTSMLLTLTPREERIVRMRFGLGISTDYTLGDIGELFSISPERVRSIESKALRKLRHPSRVKPVQDAADTLIGFSGRIPSQTHMPRVEFDDDPKDTATKLPMGYWKYEKQHPLKLTAIQLTTLQIKNVTACLCDGQWFCHVTFMDGTDGWGTKSFDTLPELTEITLRWFDKIMEEHRVT